MRNFLQSRWLNLAAVFGIGIAVVACGDEKSADPSPYFSLESSFEMVFSKAKYTYDAKDSTFKIINPVCKVGTLKNLVGPNDEKAEWDTLYYKASEKKGVVTLTGDDGVEKFDIQGTAFPVGFWADPDYDRIQVGYRVGGDGILSRVSHYNGTCFMGDYKSQLRKGNPALEQVDASLTAFYNRFKPKGDTEFDEEQMLLDIRMLTCDELTMYDGLVSIKASEITASSGNITVSYEQNSCPLSFSLRYAMNQSDCEAAFDDYNEDRNAQENFVFSDYDQDISVDEYCVEQLILDMKKAKKIPLKAAVTKSDARDFVRGVVKLLTIGLK